MNLFDLYLVLFPLATVFEPLSEFHSAGKAIGWEALNSTVNVTLFFIFFCLFFLTVLYICLYWTCLIQTGTQRLLDIVWPGLPANTWEEFVPYVRCYNANLNRLNKMHEVFILLWIITPWVYSYSGNALEHTVVDVAGIYFLHTLSPLRQKRSWNGTELTPQKNLLH